MIYSFPWITLTNVSIVLQFLAQIIPKIVLLNHAKFALEIYLSLCSADVIVENPVFLPKDDI